MGSFHDAHSLVFDVIPGLLPDYVPDAPELKPNLVGHLSPNLAPNLVTHWFPDQVLYSHRSTYYRVHFILLIWRSTLCWT